MFRKTVHLALLALLVSGCSIQERQILIAANPGICAGVVQVELVIRGAPEEVGLHRTYHTDPGRIDCSFTPDLELAALPPGDEWQVFIEGRDSAGQLVVEGRSSSFEDPPTEETVVVPVDRTALPLGTALFSLPEDWIKEGDLVMINDPTGAIFPVIDLDRTESGAWGQRRFSVTGLLEGRLYDLRLRERYATTPITGKACKIGQVFPGEVFLREDPRYSPGDCVVLSP